MNARKESDGIKIENSQEGQVESKQLVEESKVELSQAKNIELSPEAEKKAESKVELNPAAERKVEKVELNSEDSESKAKLSKKAAGEILKKCAEQNSQKVRMYPAELERKMNTIENRALLIKCPQIYAEKLAEALFILIIEIEEEQHGMQDKFQWILDGIRENKTLNTLENERFRKEIRFKIDANTVENRNRLERNPKYAIEIANIEKRFIVGRKNGIYYLYTAQNREFIDQHLPHAMQLSQALYLLNNYTERRYGRPLMKEEYYALFHRYPQYAEDFAAAIVRASDIQYDYTLNRGNRYLVDFVERCPNLLQDNPMYAKQLNEALKILFIDTDVRDYKFSLQEVCKLLEKYPMNAKELAKAILILKHNMNQRAFAGLDNSLYFDILDKLPNEAENIAKEIKNVSLYSDKFEKIIEKYEKIVGVNAVYVGGAISAILAGKGESKGESKGIGVGIATFLCNSDIKNIISTSRTVYNAANQARTLFFKERKDFIEKYGFDREIYKKIDEAPFKPKRKNSLKGIYRTAQDLIDKITKRDMKVTDESIQTVFNFTTKINKLMVRLSKNSNHINPSSASQQWSMHLGMLHANFTTILQRMHDEKQRRLLALDAEVTQESSKTGPSAP